MTIQQQRRHQSTATPATAKSTLTSSRKSMAPVAVLILVLSTLVARASAEITFTLPSNLVFRPNDFIALNWTVNPAPTAGTVPANTQPFDLQLRAATGQRYNIQTAIPQTAQSFRVQVPANVTGGKHSFYAVYRGVVTGQKNVVSSAQFTIPLQEATITVPSGTSTGGPATSTDPADPGTPAPGGESTGGLSATALGGIIAGVIAVFMAVAMIFLCRHRRRVAEDRKDSTSRAMDGRDSKGGHQDKESLTRSAGSAGGIPDNRSEGKEAVPLKLNRPVNGSLRSQHQNQNQHQQQQQQQHPVSPTATRNPFEAPEMMIHPDAPPGGGSPRQQNQHHHQYQPPQLPPPQQSPFATPPQQFSGMPPNPLMQQQGQQGGQQQRTQSPYHQNNNRDSFESELESAYDPHPRNMTPANRNNGPSPMNNGTSSPLVNSPSVSSRFPRDMSPQPNSPLHQHQTQAQQDREILAVAAAVAAAASPVTAHRQVQNQQQQQRGAAASPRIKEVEMQQFDVQQHHQEQQQKMMQRQQQQQQQQHQQQRSAQSTPVSAAQKSMNPTQFDDKTELEDSETDSDNEGPVQQQQQQQSQFPKPPPQQQQQQHQAEVKPPIIAAPTTTAPAPAPAPVPAPVVEDGPVYNGYRDTIFGAYAHNQGDDDDEDEEETVAVPALPASMTSPSVTATTTYQPPPGGAEIVRKKSVKFTGVPKSGPIVLPNHEAAKEHQQQRQQVKQQQQQLNQYQGPEDDSDEFYSQDEDEIRTRMLENEGVNSPSVNNPYQLRGDDDSSDEDDDYMNDPYGAYGDLPSQPQAPFKQQGQHPVGGVEDSPRLNAAVSPTSDDDFFGDVLAAVEKTA
ncbi:hypothetical protein BGX23_007262, partial [Mortierella sp. AD031]